MKHPNFILGLICILLTFIGIGYNANGYPVGDTILTVTAFLGGIHWIWAIYNVFTHQHVISQSQKFWIILVIALPLVGSMIYYLMNSKVVKM